MEYYNRLDHQERDILENYTARLNLSASKELFTPITTSRSNFSNRLPNLNSFSNILSKPTSLELIPRPDLTINKSKKKIKTGKRGKSSDRNKPNGRFYTDQGLNLKHPDLSIQIKKIFDLIEKHKPRCHQDLNDSNFSILKNYFR